MSDFDDSDGVELSPKSAQSDTLRTRIAATETGQPGYVTEWDTDQ